MIELLSAISRKHRWIKPLSIALGAASSCLFAYALLNSPELDAYIIPTTVGMLWSLLLFVLATAFPNLPRRPVEGDKFLRRLKLRMSRGFFYSLGFVFILLSIAAVLLSLKLLGIWRGDYAA